MKYRVLRKFSADRPLNVNDIVELNGPHVEKMVALRYLAPVTVEVVDAVPTPEPARRGPGRPRKTPIVSKE